MLLKFADKRINEFSEGNFHRTNTGEPFEVDNNLGNELLRAKTKIGIPPNAETVHVFTEAKKTKKSILADDFPLRDQLEANEIYTLEDVRALKPEDHKNLPGIGKASLQKVIDYAANLPETNESGERVLPAADAQIVEPAVEEEVEIKEIN